MSKILSLSNTFHIAKDLGQFAKYENKKYPSGEYITIISEDLRGKEVIIVGNITSYNLMEYISMIDAAIRAGGHKIILVIPYFGYSRQDKMEYPYSSRGFEIIAKIINAFKVDKLITIDIHNNALLRLFDCEVNNINISPFFLKGLDYLDGSYLVLVPDKGAKKRINYQNTICLNKRRKGNSIEFDSIVSFKGKKCILIDDILDSGRTIKGAIDFLYEKGAAEVIACVTHILGDNVPKELKFSTDSIDIKIHINRVSLSKVIKQFIR